VQLQRREEALKQTVVFRVVGAPEKDERLSGSFFDGDRFESCEAVARMDGHTHTVPQKFLKGDAKTFFARVANRHRQLEGSLSQPCAKLIAGQVMQKSLSLSGSFCGIQPT
jgi:hypothetical protein